MQAMLEGFNPGGPYGVEQTFSDYADFDVLRTVEAEERAGLERLAETFEAEGA